MGKIKGGFVERKEVENSIGKIKYIDIKEFREKGYLQEVNRQFFHPLGLALAINMDSDGSERLEGIWDYRDDPEGITYDLAGKPFSNDPNNFIEKAKTVEKEAIEKSKYRIEKFGWNIEPIK